MMMFLMTVEQAAEMYDAFLMAEAVTEREKVAILEKYVTEGKIQSLAVNATKEQIMAELTSQYRLWQLARKPKNG